MKHLIVLSGAVGSGKSSLANAVLHAYSATRLSTRQIIRNLTQATDLREDLQSAGDRLDRETDFAWIADEVARGADVSEDIVIVDAVRRREQVEHLRSRFGSRVRHIHLIASKDELRRRHASRQHEVIEPVEYEAVRASETERQVESLAPMADVILDITRLGPDSIVATALAGLGLHTLPTREHCVDVLVGGQFGSEGKGNITSVLAPDYDILVRVGGPNAGHIVYDPPFKFAQLPSGTIHNPDAALIIGPAATISLEVLASEIDRLAAMGIRITSERLSIDPQAIIIEDEDRAWEAKVLGVIGSTKQGVGAATARKILNRGVDGAFGSNVRLARDVVDLAGFVRPTYTELERAYGERKRILLEGTQGTDLSLHHGMWPHVTSRETTASGCLADAGIAPTRVRDVFMVTRTYPIRVGGTSGYMGLMIEPEELARRSGLPVDEIRRTETGTISGNPRRIAEFDLGQVVRSAQLNGATQIALTFADYLGSQNRSAKLFGDLTPPARKRIEEIEAATGIPVGLVSVGPGPKNVIDRRAH